MGIQRWLVRTVSCLYWAMLTVLLLVPSPAALLGLGGIRAPQSTPGIHFTAFVLLAMGVRAARWRWSWRVETAVLAAYALTTESLQSLVPPRTVQVLDYLENLAGLAIGAAVFWWISRWRRKTERSDASRVE